MIIDTLGGGQAGCSTAAAGAPVSGVAPLLAWQLEKAAAGLQRCNKATHTHTVGCPAPPRLSASSVPFLGPDPMPPSPPPPSPVQLWGGGKVKPELKRDGHDNLIWRLGCLHCRSLGRNEIPRCLNTPAIGSGKPHVWRNVGLWNRCVSLIEKNLLKIFALVNKKLLCSNTPTSHTLSNSCYCKHTSSIQASTFGLSSSDLIATGCIRPV
jgi:hypothetical protein